MSPWYRPSLSQLYQRAKRALGFGRVQTRQAWAGAVESRLNDFIFSTIQSAKQETRFELTKLRARARDLARNNPSARRFLKLVEQNVVGHKGIRLECQMMLKTGPNAGQPDERTNDQIEAAWRQWGRVGNCDVTRKHSWVSLQKIGLRTAARDGEAFVRIVDGYPNEFGFALQLIDPDHVDETYYGQAPETGNLIEQGVEFDRWGAPVAFYVWTSHPQDGTRLERQRERLLAADVIHLHLVEREGQVRGVTWFAPVTVVMRHLDGYTEAELVAARTAAAKMGFIKQSEESAGPDPDALPGTTVTMNAEPGSIETLGIGQDFVAWDPDHPAGNFEPFVLACQRLMAMGLNVSHMSLTGDLRQANYSSARVGLLDERDGWRDLQTWFAEHLHDRVYRRWLRMAALKLALPGMDLAKYEAVCWRARGWDWVDPKNDIEAAGLAVDRGFKSRTEIVAESGREIGDVLREIKSENQLAESLGVELLSGIEPEPAPAPIAPTPDPGAEPSGNGRAVMRLRPLTNGRTA